MRKDTCKNLPSPSVGLQERPGSTRDFGAIQPKTIEQHPGTSAENSNVGLTTDPQKLSTTDIVTSNVHSLKPPPRLFALIIGINEYESPNVPKLSGAVPDADDVLSYLQKHLRVPSSQITNLRDSKATRSAVIDGITAFSLNDDIKVGDPILIYYAGHGGSADTPKGWGVGSTGKIELLIPCDHSSPLEDSNPKHGIPDRTLGALLSHLANKKGDNITVILDCCHSGSGTRNFKDPTEGVRGIDTGNVPPDLDRDVWIDLEFESSMGTGRGTDVNAGSTHGGLRSHVLLAACGSEEFAIEREGRGLFTKRLFNTLRTSHAEIDKLTYAGLLKQMPLLSVRQSPQCEGVNQNRAIFDAKATSKSTVPYKICEDSEGEGYVMPDVGAARGIRLGAEFEVYQDSGERLGIVVARDLRPFSTTLYAIGPRFDLNGDGVALLTSAGTEEPVLRIHVADKGLEALVKKIEKTDPSHRIIQVVERDQEAEFGLALEDGKVVFDIFDPLVKEHGLKRMPFRLEPTLEAISHVLRGADHFYLHLRRTPKVESATEKGLANVVDVEVAEIKHDGISYDDDLEPVLSPTTDGWKRGRVFDLQINDSGTIYGWKIINKSKVKLYPALFYFDNSDWSITSYYQPPTALGTVDPPLKGQQFLPVGYGDSGTVPHTFFLREGQNVDVGILKLYLSREHVDFADVAQLSPFDSIGTRSTTEAKLKTPPKVRHLWDTILVPVIQKRAVETERLAVD